MSDFNEVAIDRAETTEEFVWDCMPHRIEESHKGTYGKLLVVAGSSRFRGAAALCTEGALRSGCGIVTLASVEPVFPSIQTSLPEAVFFPCRINGNGGISADMRDELIEEAHNDHSAIVLGPGLGNTEDTVSIVRGLVENTNCGMILDADALNALTPGPHPWPKESDPVKNIYVQADIDFTSIPEQYAAVENWPKHPSPFPIVVTPHPGEMARLLKMPVATVKANMEQIALAFARDNNCVVVLKDHRTIIASPRGKVWRNTTGNSGLARGGSGDILAGMIGSFLALGMDPFEASVCACWLHGKAADLCAARCSKTGMLPHDIFPDLQQILLENNR
ncbi:MAG: NAD(P)H-hydrate dehydratase [Clostridia bacterium]|nr:NAD(P)H-hydrate dehydratase [Clostridia bacterium]